MELKDFVKETLIEISQGVSEAQESQGDALINPRIKIEGKESSRVILAEDGAGRDISGDRILDYVDFDVAVTIDKGTKTDGKISVLFGAFNLSSSGESKNTDTSISRVKFKVPVSFSIK